MGDLTANLIFTQKEFFLLDEGRGNLEYWAGRILQPENNTIRHGQLILNIGATLRNLLPPGCKQMTNVNLRAGHKVHILKPDLMVVCNPEFYQKRDDTLVNPALVFEVLSDSTSVYDKTEKLSLYRSVPSIQEYVLVSQREPQVWRYGRQSGASFWSPEMFSGLDAFVELQSLGGRISMAEIYRDVEFPAS